MPAPNILWITLDSLRATAETSGESGPIDAQNAKCNTFVIPAKPVPGSDRGAGIRRFAAMAEMGRACGNDVALEI